MVMYMYALHPQAQAAVKETKSRFEKLKNDLTEKINMVSASRCNLLSHTLPNYQKEVLAFSDRAANISTVSLRICAPTTTTSTRSRSWPRKFVI